LCNAQELQFHETVEWDGAENPSPTLDCWLREQETANAETSEWGLFAGYSTTVPNASEGESFLLLPYAGKVSVVSPEINMENALFTTLTYDYIMANDGAGIDTLRVYYRTAPSEEWQLLNELNAPALEWSKDVLALPNPTATYQIKFAGIGGDGYGIGIDDIWIEGIYPPQIVTLAADPVGENTATLNSTITLGTEENVIEQGYKWRALTAPESEWIVSATGDLSGLIAETTYEFFAYIVLNSGTYTGDTLSFITLQTGIKNVFSDNVSIYPNPAQHIATLVVDGLFPVSSSVVLTDLAGRVIETYSLGAFENKLNIDVSNLSDGTYFVRIISDNTKSIQKLVVKK
jgi:hypothetical protein